MLVVALGALGVLLSDDPLPQSAVIGAGNLSVAFSAAFTADECKRVLQISRERLAANAASSTSDVRTSMAGDGRPWVSRSYVVVGSGFREDDLPSNVADEPWLVERVRNLTRTADSALWQLSEPQDSLEAPIVSVYRERDAFGWHVDQSFAQASRARAPS